MGINELLPWIAGANALLSLVTAVYVMVTSGSKGNTADLASFKADTATEFENLERDRNARAEAITERFGLIELRVATIDEALKHLPDREASHRLEIAIERLTGQMETLDERLSGRIETLSRSIDPITAISERWQELILEQAKR